MKRGLHRLFRVCSHTLLLLCLLTGLSVLAGGLVAPAYAATIILVNTCNEASLDSALSSATNGSTIKFTCSGTITNTNTLNISNSITLDGSGQQVTIDGGNSVQVLQVNSGVNFTLNDLTITHGFIGGNGAGGGIVNSGGSVSITNSTITGNNAGIGAGIDNDRNGGSVIITNSTISNNSANFGAGGGITTSSGQVVITDSTLSGNSANQDAGGAIYIDTSANVSIKNSTLANNTTSSSSGFGGAIYNTGSLTLTNSTVAGNTANNGGGIFSSSSSPVSVTNTTIANNSGGGLNATSSNFSISGTLLANNTPGSCLTLGFTDNGYNLSSDTSCHLSATGDQEGVDPKLDTNGLQSNGGFTQTIALQQGSPAIDAQASGCPATDQRGVPRPDTDTSETSCDIGAFETQYAAPDTTAPTLQLPSTITVNATSPQGAYVSYTVTATDPDNPSNQLSISCSPASGTQFAIGSTTVNCSASDPAGNSTTGSFSVVVQPVLSVSAINISAKEGKSFSEVVATGTNYGTTGTLSATITWGDGQTSAGTVTVTGNGIYSVIGKHTYAEEGTFTVGVAVKDSGSLSASGTSSATVADAALTASKPTTTINGLAITMKTVFTDADPHGTVSDYSATIIWGDGTTTSATIANNTSGKGFIASGTHTYARHKTYTVKVTITDAGGSHVMATVQITV